MWFSDFTLVLPDRVIEHGSLRIEDGHIAEITDAPVPGGIPGRNLCLMPGFIDMHGDMIEIELEPRPRVTIPMELALMQLDARLAASGVTTAYAAVSFSRSAADGAPRSYEHTSATIRALQRSRSGLRIDHKIHARFDITFDNAVEVLAALVMDGMVDLVSLMDHTPGQGQYRDIERFVDQIAHIRGVSEFEARQIVTNKIAERHRPEAVILSTLEAVSAVCKANGVSMASHDDDSPKKANLMADMGASISEFPVTEDAARIAISRGMMTAMGAPNALRGLSYSGNLSAREAHSKGLLSILAADYHPGTILPAIKILAEADRSDLSGAVRLATTNPAEALALTDRGSLMPGLRADLVVADLSGIGRAVATFSAGQLAYSSGILPLSSTAQTLAIA
ncbi:MAG: alpha-D-ribose 1-methylphosphonate 5-triphosphate diphosphatase [Pseudomonadota bacterium]